MAETYVLRRGEKVLSPIVPNGYLMSDKKCLANLGMTSCGIPVPVSLDCDPVTSEKCLVALKILLSKTAYADWLPGGMDLIYKTLLRYLYAALKETGDINWAESMAVVYSILYKASSASLPKFQDLQLCGSTLYLAAKQFSGECSEKMTLFACRVLFPRRQLCEATRSLISLKHFQVLHSVDPFFDMFRACTGF